MKVRRRVEKLNVHRRTSPAGFSTFLSLPFVVAVVVLVGSSHRVSAATQAGTPPSDVRIVARVNGEPITRAELQRLLDSPLERQQIEQELGIEPKDSEELERAALKRLIQRRLILQEAKRRKLTITDRELNDAIKSLRRRFADLKDLGVWMKEQGVDEKSLFETIHTEMLATRVRAALVADVRMTDEQAQQYYDAHREELKVDEVRLQIIVVNEEAAAGEVLEALKKGDNFGTLARDRSVGSRARRGGDTGWVDSATLWGPLRAAVSRMKPRQVHGPIPRDAEFLIVRLDDRRLGRTKTLTEARPDIERRLLPQQQRAAIQAWLLEREKTSTIELIAKAE